MREEGRKEEKDDDDDETVDFTNDSSTPKKCRDNST
jgi:hypothetical protein